MTTSTKKAVTSDENARSIRITWRTMWALWSSQTGVLLVVGGLVFNASSSLRTTFDTKTDTILTAVGRIELTTVENSNRNNFHDRSLDRVEQDVRDLDDRVRRLETRQPGS